jgi:hypothetical protein
MRMINYKTLVLNLIPIALLLWAFYPNNPYIFFKFLRIVVCVGLAINFFINMDQERNPFFIISLVVFIIVYNPIIPIYLKRDIWLVINILTIPLLLYSAFNKSPNRKVRKNDLLKFQASSESNSKVIPPVQRNIDFKDSQGKTENLEYGIGDENPDLMEPKYLLLVQHLANIAIELDLNLNKLLKTKLKTKKHTQFYPHFIIVFPISIMRIKNLGGKERQIIIDNYLQNAFELFDDQLLIDFPRFRSWVLESTSFLSDRDFIEEYFDVEKIEENDYKLLIKMLADSDVDIISQGSVNLLKRILKKTINQTFIEFDEPTIFEVLNIEENDFERTNEDQPVVVNFEHIIKVPIDWHSLAESLMRDLPEKVFFDSVAPIKFSTQSVKSLLEKVNLVISKIGLIPEDFSNGVIFNPNRINCFNINELLNVFGGLSMKDGFILDYIFALDGHGGEPFPYSRNANETPLENKEEYCHKFEIDNLGMLLGNDPTIENTYPYLNCIEIDEKAFSTLELSLFCMMVRRFYLIWHSSYNDRKYILTITDLDRFCNEQVGNFENREYEMLKKIDPSPTVFKIDDYSKIRLFNYEQNIGYSFLNLYFRKNLFVKLDQDVLHTSKSKMLY